MVQELKKTENSSKKITKQLSYKEVEEKVLEFIPSSQIPLKLILAVAASSGFNNQLMLWLLLVGVPSSGKTDLVRLVRDSGITYSLDNLTQNAFVSGERASETNKVHDLLPILDKKCLVIKDWTAILSLNEEMTRKLLGELVGIYDKEYSKFSSRRGNVTYTSIFSQLGCITPATLNRHTTYMNLIGPRFMSYTMPGTTATDEGISYENIFSGQNRMALEETARVYVSSYLDQLVSQKFNINPLKDGTKNYLKVAAKLMSNCRGVVIIQASTFRSESGEDVKSYDILDVQIEEPWRAVQQLISLANYLAFVVGKNTIEADELAIIKDVVISSMPADRSQALRMIKNQAGVVTAKQLAEVSDRSVKTTRRLLEELHALQVLEKEKGSGTAPAVYKISPQFEKFLLLDTKDFLSHYARGTETSNGLSDQKSKFPLEGNGMVSLFDDNALESFQQRGGESQNEK